MMPKNWRGNTGVGTLKQEYFRGNVKEGTILIYIIEGTLEREHCKRNVEEATLKREEQEHCRKNTEREH